MATTDALCFTFIADDTEEPEWDSPHGSEWIVSIDHEGILSILEPPHICPGLLEYSSPEEIGLPWEFDKEPGVYKLVCDFASYRRGEYDSEVEYEFTERSMEPLWLVSQVAKVIQH